MSEKRTIKAIIKNWWLILLVTLISTGGAAFYSINNSNPIYKATTTLYVMPTTSNSSIITSDSIIVSQQLAKDYIELIKSDQITSAVAENLGIKKMTERELSTNLLVTMVKGSNLLEIAIFDANSEKAQSIANAFAKISIEKLTGITNQNNFSIVDAAKLPSAPVAKNKYMMVILSFLLSLFAICGIIIMLEYFQNTAHTVEDIEKALGYSVIGIIPEMDIK